MVGRPLPPMATNPIYDVNGVSPLYDVIPEPCGAKATFQKQQSLLSLDPRLKLFNNQNCLATTIINVFYLYP